MQIANITIKDGASTPVDHTFIPVNITNGDTARLRENVAATPLVGQSQLKISVRDLKSGIKQAHIEISTPVLEATAGGTSGGYVAAPKVAYTPLVGATFNFDARSTVEQRKNLRSLLINALANAIIIDAVDNLNPPF